MKNPTFRTETDSMGEIKVPIAALYGAETQRAVENFPISNLRFSREFIPAMGLVKLAAAQSNIALGLLNPRRVRAVVRAARRSSTVSWTHILSSMFSRRVRARRRT